MDSSVGRGDHPVFPVTHSIPAPTALLSEVARRYGIGAPDSCVLLHAGLNDSYLIRTERGRWVLRVYRTGWRTHAAIEWELDLLAHLDGRGCSVSTPLTQVSGERIWTMHVPEGWRHVVLFTYAEGAEPYADQGTEDDARAYGAAVAALHLAMEGFSSPHERSPLDLAHLVDAPLHAVEPFLAHRRADWRHLEGLGDQLKAHISTLVDAGLACGVCHGDCHGGNARRAGETLTFFDFDCGGPGWWAYDPGVFLWSSAWNGKDAALMPAYLAGYQSRRPLGAADQAALPAFAALRQIWFMGLQAANSGYRGTSWLEDRSFGREIAFLEECASRALG